MSNEDIAKLKIDKAPAIKGGAKNKRKIIYISATAAVAFIFILLFISGVLSPAVRVQVATVSQIYPAQTFTLLNASGYVVAQRKAAISSKVTGRIIELNVEEGSRVKKGDIIARLESEDVKAAKSQANANLSTARYNLEKARADLYDAELAFKRNRELIKKGYIAQSEYDTSEARYRSSKAAVEAADSAVKSSAAALKAADVAMDYTLLRSPFNAVVLTKNADVGDIVTPLGATANVQSAVVTVADMDSLIVEADVSESNIGQVRTGQPCEVQLDALPDKRFRGIVHMIVPTADRTKATVMVKVRFIDKDDRVLPEMSAKVAFLSREIAPDEMKPFTAINQSALVPKNGVNKVFVVLGDTAKEVTITTGKSSGDMVEVIQGLKVGDKVVLRPSDKLHDGSKISTEEK